MKTLALMDRQRWVIRNNWPTCAIASLIIVAMLHLYWSFGFHIYKISITTVSTANSIQTHLTSPYGGFPSPSDPFHFIPCTNSTLPPLLDSPDPQHTWAGLFDPDPHHWSWGKSIIINNKDSERTMDDPYSGRGIYLCGYLDLPLDYSNSSDERVTRLAVTKFQVSGLARITTRSDPRGTSKSPAGRKSERTIVIEPGGPGASGTREVWQEAEGLTERFSSGQFDVLGWDPRGVNTSLPSLACFHHDLYRDHWTLRSWPRCCTNAVRTRSRKCYASNSLNRAFMA